jgi:surfeit locus 1 family protein
VAALISLRIGQVRFSPSLPSTLVTLVLLPLFIALGLWQLDRAQYKRGLEMLYAERAQDVPVSLDRPVTHPSALRYRLVELSGRFDPRHTVLLDNRVHHGRVGYEVFTPFEVQGAGLWVLVNRGWVPQGESRSDLPAIATPTGGVDLRGIINLPPGMGLTLGEEEDPSVPAVVQQVDIARLSSWAGVPLQPIVVLLDPASRYGFVREWQPAPTGAGRHLAYAVQWFGMALALLILYLVINSQRPPSES